MNIDEHFMLQAIKQASKAAELLEAPIGAVIVKDGKVIARGYNKREVNNNSLAHAEIIAINKACKKLNSWRLVDCTLYVTLEPCPMCAGAIIQSRIKRVVFGADDYKAGTAGSVVNLFEPNMFNHNVEVVSGVLKDDCSSLLSDFFKRLRIIKKG